MLEAWAICSNKPRSEIADALAILFLTNGSRLASKGVASNLLILPLCFGKQQLFVCRINYAVK
jgi:hypothetical protein